MLACAETQYQDAFGDPLMKHMAECVPTLAWHRRDVPQELPKAQSSKALLVVVNHARWIVRCPCGGAQIASRSDRRFFCVDCLNAWCGSKWVRVRWPDEADDIHAALARRVDPETRNWEPHETVADLEAENAAHGVR